MHISFRYVLPAYIGASVAMLGSLVLSAMGEQFLIEEAMKHPGRFVLAMVASILLWPLFTLVSFIFFETFEVWMQAAVGVGIILLFGLPYVPEKWKEPMVGISMGLLSIKALLVCCVIIELLFFPRF